MTKLFPLGHVLPWNRGVSDPPEPAGEADDRALFRSTKADLGKTLHTSASTMSLGMYSARGGSGDGLWRL